MQDPAAQLPLAFRFEKKPNVIMGLTWPECTYAASASGAIALVFGLILGGLIGKWMLALLEHWLAVCSKFLLERALR